VVIQVLLAEQAVTADSDALIRGVIVYAEVCERLQQRPMW
jgi:hypothetical protein